MTELVTLLRVSVPLWFLPSALSGLDVPLPASAIWQLPEPASQLVNLSARAYVGTGDNVLIDGLVIRGDAPHKLLIRAVGPTLASQGIASPLQDPVLTIYRGQTSIAANDDWNDPAVATDGAAAGAFALPAGSKDAALIITLDPGVYTAIVSGKNGTTGVALLEVYDVTPPPVIPLPPFGQVTVYKQGQYWVTIYPGPTGQ